MNISLLSGRYATILTVFVGACAVSTSVWAQETPAPMLAPEMRLRAFRLHNVRPSLVAYWLDAKDHPAPAHFKSEQPLSNLGLSDLNRLPRLPGNGNGPLDIKLPTGIKRLVANDPQDELIVSGTADGLAALEPLLVTLDVPLVQYEVEARFYDIGLADLPQTGLKFQGAEDNTFDTFCSVASVPTDFGASIEKLMADKRAAILTAPRLTLIDGLTGQLQQTTTTPIIVDQELMRQHPPTQPAVINDPFSPIPGSSNLAPGLAMMTTEIGVNATVVQRQDGLISLAVSPTLETRTVSVTATMRENQPLAIRMSSAKEERQIVIVVTARRIRRAGD